MSCLYLFLLQCLFWARTYNWQFEKYRDVNFDTLSPEALSELKLAMDQEGFVRDSDIEACTPEYFSRMSPNVVAINCACCGHRDVPRDMDIPNFKEDVKIQGIRSYFNIRLSDPKLVPLRYTALETELYNKLVPLHITENEENIVLWSRYKQAISCHRLILEDQVISK